MSIQKKLSTWVEQGLITTLQAETIRAYEQRRGGIPLALYSVVGLGVTVLVLGLISLIAANWNDIPAWLKLTSYFLVEGFVGAMFLKHARQPGLYRELFLALFALLILAGIGLIAQVFHLPMTGWSALFLFLALSLPITLDAQGRMMSHVWFAGLGLMLILWAEARDAPEQILVFAAYVVAALGLAPLSPQHLNRAFKQAALVWGMGCIGIVLPVIASFQLFAGDSVVSTTSRFNLLPWAGCLLVVGATLLSSPPYASVRKWRFALSTMLVSVTAFYSVPQLFNVGHQAFTSAALFIFVYSFAAMAAAIAERQRLFDVISFAIAARFIVVYFEILGSLAATGVGLIVSGLLILGIASLWYKSRQRLMTLVAKGS